jgi:predicted O-linked N-acetylglucosamine transferase (SPINDLY family)
VNDGTHDPYNDHIYEKIKNSVDHMVNLESSLESCARRIFDDKIDVLVDLGLFTAYSRMDVFSVRPAPIQVAYLGLATTTGADYYDYMVGDRYVIPEESEKYYSGILVTVTGK